jgi:O-acetyl-ADP-ribose deacetylase (regulator of RNase III)
MIHYVRGDILHSRTKVIAHGVAPDDHFATGLALALRERWPSMVKDFRHWCHQTHPKPGELWTWSGPGLRVVNLLTQAPSEVKGGHPGRASLDHVNHCLRRLRKEIGTEKFESLALPRLATGVGGLPWGEVKALLEHHLGSLTIPIWVYATYQQGVAAEETV